MLIPELRNIDSLILVCGPVFPIPSLVLSYESKVQAQCH